MLNLILFPKATTSKQKTQKPFTDDLTTNLAQKNIKNYHHNLCYEICDYPLFVTNRFSSPRTSRDKFSDSKSTARIMVQAVSTLAVSVKRSVKSLLLREQKKLRIVEISFQKSTIKLPVVQSAAARS
jgi:hypothetical protein